jgi:hypothetical protein
VQLNLKTYSLGLATVYGIVKNHGGNITVYSEPGIGTTFNVYLSATPDKEAEQKIDSEVIKGDVSILVIEDEEHIREIAKDRLEQSGYIILLAGDGKEGLEIYIRERCRITENMIPLVILSRREICIGTRFLDFILRTHLEMTNQGLCNDLYK